MSEPNYEAIGRCKVLKGEIRELAEKRRGMLAALVDHFNAWRSGSQADVKNVQTTWARERLDMIDEANAAIADKIEKHNRYARDAGEQLISVSR